MLLDKFLAAGVALAGVLLVHSASAGPNGHQAHAHGHHAHAHNFAAGQPGKAGRKTRTIEVTMREGDGKMLFAPETLTIKRGEQIRFVLSNVGELDHEFVLGTTAENLKHAEDMQKNPDMAHDDPNATRLAPKGKGELLWRFTKAGTFEYGCLIPGHREAGMTGTIVVK